MFRESEYIGLNTLKMLKDKSILNESEKSIDQYPKITIYEVNNWLMEHKGLCVVVKPFVYEEYDEEGYTCSTDRYWTVSIFSLYKKYEILLDEGFDFYENAFERGIQEALKMIK